MLAVEEAEKRGVIFRPGGLVGEAPAHRAKVAGIFSKCKPKKRPSSPPPAERAMMNHEAAGVEEFYR